MDRESANEAADYVIRVVERLSAVDAGAWNTLLARQPLPTPFMRHDYLLALEASGCATPATGWTPRALLLERGGRLAAACLLYLKTHSRGEYVFDQAWAQAYARHGLGYYPKAVCAVPFTPVPGSRLLADCAADRARLIAFARDACRDQGLSGLHLLFGDDADRAACAQAGLLARHDVQFHWHNRTPAYADFDDFLATLTQDKRKKIRQERRKVMDAGVRFRTLQGAAIGDADWDFFFRCYERTYLEHGQHPYLNRDFFRRMAQHMPEDWLLFVAERAGRPIAASLIALNASCVAAAPAGQALPRVAYGRYWGALERVDCLHFEACYYQPLTWCIAHGYQRFEGGAQGEHKLARALLPVQTSSQHWLDHPGFFDAVDRYLGAEGEAVQGYLQALQAHSPFKSPA